MTSQANDFAQEKPIPLSQSNLHAQNTNLADGGTSTVADSSVTQGNQSTLSQSHTLTPSRGGTLKKKASLSKKSSLRRTGSKRNSHVGSTKDLAFADDSAVPQSNDAFHVPVPTTGTPTEVLANRFQGMHNAHKESNADDYSVEESTERYHHLLPRSPKVLRGKI